MTTRAKENMSTAMLILYRGSLVVCGFLLQDAYRDLKNEITLLRSDNKVLTLTVAVEQRQNDVNQREISWLKAQVEKLQDQLSEHQRTQHRL